MLDLALPKGSLEEQTLLLFKQADLEIRKTDREYNPTVKDPRIRKVKILRPQEIPKYVEEGYFDLGISGKDWVMESDSDIVEVADMFYSKMGEGIVKIVIAVPNEKDIKSAKDIKPGSRVSTEYPNLTKKFFDKLGIPVDLRYSYGATEAKVPELVDVIVDLTETGSTLRKNGLKIVDIILESNTKLIANKKSMKDPVKRKEIEEIRILLQAVLEARGKVFIVMNVPEDKLDAVVSGLPAMKRPTVSKLYKSDYYAVETVVSKSEINILIPRLKALGAEDILEIDITKIVH
ncbi:MAG: ATP phosphoribosyltransferase [Candidatus Methanoperedens nitroreducens]|uniref:ATP phosphoribosyltransferase n=1 Tax=Candidatus Methanoperedens nitratireducens TaxID=1392998 RepID=A0A0P8C332_9EURY|nr:ATP phosphoribosyltransferase [Candidatus Methanoperedens sp. BLZ2]KAB2947456.1 MAG: ATP phosphoribosyltransferase [Candidatus Methanoperedens sp.]KPQ40936.1 MAG: ATP phosphoribosyltransferase [Candidatus Methanoperedens sp. BLZ1]MBZ0175178.1 ATP phosphoribosyltransferase [Candidatus Methanoperedens nitroreducens]MCX9078741.1 ATP phosphoribosyltransferase [Candidatus Methanoperedens sp.]MCX9088258.1 ATP phosphoribosyltransferase [Candidatus Methanoperedens sp.]